MTAVIVAFGAATALTGVAMLFDPEIVFGRLRRYREAVGTQVLAVAVRVVLGALLVAHAEASRYPVFIAALGWLAIGAAVVLGVMGRRRFIALISWATGLSGSFRRVGGLFAVGFGAFLVYAFAL